jgi:hypothetical protein
MDANQNKPIVPRPSEPRFLTPDGKPCYGAEEEYHFRCFDLFREFADFMNSWRMSTPFRLQELGDTKITYHDGELDLGPNYGHRYDIFYYQGKVGLLQIYAKRVIMSSDGLRFSDQVQIEEHEVHVDFSLDTFSPTIIPFKDIQEYLNCVARMTTSDTKQCFYTEHQYAGMSQRRYAIYAIEQAMMKVIWDNHNVESDKASPMTLFFSGAPTEWYRHFRVK